MSSTILMSVQPKFARLIYEDRKRFEFRRVRCSIQNGDRILIYETAPISLITGEFVVGEVIIGNPLRIAFLESDESRNAVIEYLKGSKFATALEIINIVKWSKPVGLSELSPVVRAPQSYLFLNSFMEVL